MIKLITHILYKEKKVENKKMKNDLTNYGQILKQEGLALTPKTNFKSYSLMFDLSRGRVFKLDYLKEVLTKVAKFGVNEVWLYLEDVYKLNEPYFGFNRGAYSMDDFLQLDKHAQSLGIELVFSIQTLAHMENFLRWPSSGKYKDTYDTLLVESDDTYNLIKKMFSFTKKAFSSTKIHIGLDEAYNLGLGNYLINNGYHKQKTLFINHLKKVKELALEAGYQEILLWSDMFVKLSFNIKSYYDTFDLDKVSKPLPLNNLNLVYWDYYNIDQNRVASNIDLHLKLTKNTTFASGIWIWQRPVVDVNKTFDTTKVAIEEASKKGLANMNFTLWNDNGGYCNPDDFLMCMPKISEQIFNLPDGSLKTLYEKLTKKDLAKELAKSIINNFANIEAIILLYDDPIYGVYIDQLVKYYKKDLTEAIFKLNEFNINDYKNDLEFYHLFHIIRLKLQLRVAFKNNVNDQEQLSLLVNEYKELAKHYQDYLVAFTKNWQKTSKENGLEMHQYRLAGLKLRVEHMINLLKTKANFKEFIDEPSAKQALNTLFDTVAYTLRLTNN